MNNGGIVGAMHRVFVYCEGKPDAHDTNNPPYRVGGGVRYL